MRLIDADDLKICYTGTNGKDDKACYASIRAMIDNRETVRCAIYKGDTGFFDGCTNGCHYHVIDDRERNGGLIVLVNDLGSTSKLLKEKFEFVSK
jgi:hypothetical protein